MRINWKDILLAIIELILPMVIDEIIDESDSDVLADQVPDYALEQMARNRISAAVHEALQQ